MNVVFGNVIAVEAARPLCSIDASHSTGSVPSPGSGNWWPKVQESTLRYVDPLRTFVVTVVRRLRVKNAGENWFGHDVVEEQIRSNGTSGHFAAFADVSCAGSQVIVPDGRQRSATVNSTRAGEFAVSSPARCP